VIVEDSQGVPRTLKAGDTMFFPAGSSAIWTVPEYVRKVAFLRYPMVTPLVLLYRFVNKLKRVMGSEKTSTGF
ncbi:MAG: cupin domain-containing protein, partial [Pseudomonadota bacterium]|nr:cupin domain-containing protein [Pseudomonadota bacterium]